MPWRHDPQFVSARRSLRTRLTLWVVAVFVIFQALTGGAYWLYHRAAAHDAFRNQLVEHAQGIASRLQPRIPGITREDLEAAAQETLAHLEFDHFAADLVDAQGRSVAGGSAQLPLQPPDAAPGPSQSQSPDQSREAITDLIETAARTGQPEYADLRKQPALFSVETGEMAKALALPVAAESGQTYYLVVTTTDAFVQRQMGLVARVLLAGGLLGILAAAISGWFIAGLAVSPLHRLAGLAGNLRPETLNQSILVQKADDSEVRKLAEELESSRRRIRDAFAAQERFLSNISHEMKTPIATVLTEAQTVRREKLPDDAAAFIDTAQDEMRKLGRLVESFLTLTRIKDGRGLTRTERYSASELVTDTLDDVSRFAAESDIQLVPTLDASDRALDAEILGEPSLLRTMLANLVNNAIRFSPPGGRVHIETAVHGSRFLVTVADRGPGVPQDLLTRVFDRYLRGGQRHPGERGQGIGLAIAKGIAELHSGDIAAANRDGSGAVFTISLPFVSPSDDPPPPSSPHPGHPAADHLDGTPDGAHAREGQPRVPEPRRRSLADVARSHNIRRYA